MKSNLNTILCCCLVFRIVGRTVSTCSKIRMGSLGPFFPSMDSGWDGA